MPLISSSRFIVLCQTIGIPSLSPLARVFGVDDSLARSRSAQIHANEETGTDQLYESQIRPLTGEMSPEFPITVSEFYVNPRILLPNFYYMYLNDGCRFCINIHPVIAVFMYMYVKTIHMPTPNACPMTYTFPPIPSIFTINLKSKKYTCT